MISKSNSSNINIHASTRSLLTLPPAPPNSPKFPLTLEIESLTPDSTSVECIAAELPPVYSASADPNMAFRESIASPPAYTVGPAVTALLWQRILADVTDNTFGTDCGDVWPSFFSNATTY